MTFYILISVIFTAISSIILLKTISYGLYEIKANSNKLGGIACILIEIIAFVLTIYVLWLK